MLYKNYQILTNEAGYYAVYKFIKGAVLNWEYGPLKLPDKWEPVIKGLDSEQACKDYINRYLLEYK